MSENPTSDEIDENEDQDLDQSAGAADTLDAGGYGGPGPENETDDDGS